MCSHRETDIFSATLGPIIITVWYFNTAVSTGPTASAPVDESDHT
jgi:hypothetical protein